LQPRCVGAEEGWGESDDVENGCALHVP
jgi:hypothetical protein